MSTVHVVRLKELSVSAKHLAWALGLTFGGLAMLKFSRCLVFAGMLGLASMVSMFGSFANAQVPVHFRFVGHAEAVAVLLVQLRA